jgi:hypothetical protein
LGSQTTSLRKSHDAKGVQKSTIEESVLNWKKIEEKWQRKWAEANWPDGDILDTRIELI